MNKRAVLIFSGFNTRGVVSFCRFCRQNNIPFFIVALYASDVIFATEYKHNVVEIRVGSALTVESIVKCGEGIRKKNEISQLLILPSTEYLNRFLLMNKDFLEANEFIVPLCDTPLYEQLSDKYSFTDLCRLNNINVPGEYNSLDIAELPFVAKPKKYFSRLNAVSEKPILVKGEQELENLTRVDPENFYFQQFIGGRSFYLLFYFSANGSYSVFSQENLIQQHNGLSIIAARAAEIHLQPIASVYASLLLNSGFKGLIMIEIKLFKEKYYMIEANPRLWGPSQLVLDSGMDLFDRFALDHQLISSLPSKNYLPGTKYFWRGGIIEDQKKNVETSFHNYDKNFFFDEYAQWCQADVYYRPDTVGIALGENNYFPIT